MKRLCVFFACAIFLGCGGGEGEFPDASGGGGGDSRPALYAAAYGEVDGGGVWVIGGAGGELARLTDADIEGGDMGQVVSKGYVTQCVDLYAGTAYYTTCKARGDDMRQVPSIGWFLKLIDMANGGATSFGTGEYATMQASTKPSVDEGCRRLVRPFVVGGAARTPAGAAANTQRSCNGVKIAGSYGYKNYAGARENNGQDEAPPGLEAVGFISSILR
jgi:hypothetical protein